MTAGDASARLFVGLALSEGAREAIAATRAQVVGDMRHHDPALYHLTLCFLGMVSRERTAGIGALIDAHAFEPFALKVGAWGTFRRGTILYLGIERPCEALMALQDALASALKGEGFVLDEAEYVPHITIARGVKRIERLPVPPCAMFSVAHATLFESLRVEGQLRYLPIR